MKYVVATTSIGDDDFVFVSVAGDEEEDDNCGCYNATGEIISEQLRSQGHTVVEEY